MRKQPFGQCALCLKDRKLHDSHLVSAAAYKPLLATNSRNRHPLIISNTFAYQTSRQAKDYLLCFECEQRFREGGEDWVLTHSYRGPGQFKLRDILRSNSPRFSDPESAIYSGASIRELDMEKVIYFAVSVFWRAAVHNWRRDSRVIKFELGPYEEALRKFLYEDAPFPSYVALQVWASSLKDDLCAVVHLPEAGVHEGAHVYQFGIPGMTFRLTVGKTISEKFYLYSTAPSPERFVAIIQSVDIKDLSDMAQNLAQFRGAR
jgi:hypothetical protein